ncbi:MAG TPA: polyhydroxyalkanoate synthesis repressor PhaR [Gammaproteobacteria bacterium]|nr:polyhydroxyalkanoate synthesis repressor PhaR [Gammaproteobacteria bacterium]
MAEKRIIKKYPNRRLYDTTESKYITLEDVRHLIMQGVPFCVVDKQTEEDITRSILLQIIIEQEEVGASPLFSTDALQQLIGFYGKSLQNMAAQYIQQSLSLFTNQQQRLGEQMTRAVSNNPMTAWSKMTEQNLELWQRMQNEFLKAAGMPVSSGSSTTGTATTPTETPPKD